MCRDPAIGANNPQKRRNLLFGEFLEVSRLSFAHFARPVSIMVEKRLKISSKVAGHRRRSLGAAPNPGKGGYSPRSFSLGNGARDERRSTRRILRSSVAFGRTGDHFRGLGRTAASAIIWLRVS